jgi:hypothetical protein
VLRVSWRIVGQGTTAVATDSRAGNARDTAAER